MSAPTTTPAVADLLEVEDLSVVYDGTVVALRGVSLNVPAGSVVALLGANGAGKTTLLRTISGLVSAGRGEVTAGHIRYRGADIQRQDAARIVAGGLIQVLEGRHCFPHLTVEENVKMGALPLPSRRRTLTEDLERVYDLFPRLRERRSSLAGYTSGGEQQMVAIGRALMARPRLLLLDEPSMGLAPRIVEEIFEVVAALNRSEGLTVLLAEQNAALALPYADRGYLMENGAIPLSGAAAELLADDLVEAVYLGGQIGVRPAPGVGAGARSGTTPTEFRGRDRPRRAEFAVEARKRE
jgi:branched-chain amino acid transport system ATP-binding protein